jgi:hypothetical protein
MQGEKREYFILSFVTTYICRMNANFKRLLRIIFIITKMGNLGNL